MDLSSSTEDLGGKPECSVSLDQPVSCLLSKQRRYGVVRFIGRTQFGPGVWCGIELNEPHGKNDGAVGGVRYFKCEAYYGIFVKAKNAQPIRADSEIGSHSNNKQGRRRVLPSLGQESPAVLFDELQDRKKKATPPDDDKDVNEDPEERPRSKSEIVLTNDRTDMLHIFSSSPFKCDIRGGKSSSLSKLNNATYICNSPASPSLFENEVFRDPKHSSPLSSLQDPSAKPSSIHSYHEHDGSSSTHVAKSSAMTHCTQLSPQFEVKQSIKLGSIKNTRLLGLSASVEGREATMNKTFLIRKENPEFESKAEDLNSKELLTDTASNVNVSNGKSSSTGESVMEASSETQRSCKKENLNSTFVSIDGSNCDFTEARSRSVSKSSWSSIESLSSVGSAKTDKERRKVKTTEAYNGLSSKIPRTQDSSKSKLVKISAGCRGDSKRCKEEESSTAGCRGDSKRCKEEQSSTISGMDVSITSGNKSVESRKTLSNKSRTKSTSAVSSGRASSALHTTAPKSTVKHKSKSVSSDGKEKSATIKNRSGASKLVTPQVPKVSGALSSRHVTSTPVRATPMREKKSIVSCVATTTGSKPSTSSSSTSRGKQLRSMSQSESSKTESRISSRQFKTKVVDCDKRQTRPEHSRPATEKTRSVSTSAAENRDTSGSVLKSSSVKPAVLRVSETFSSAKKSSRLPRKLLETSSDRAVVKKKPHSEDSIKKQDGKANTVIQNSVMVNRLSSAHTPDILQQTPEIKGQSVGIQVASLKAERYEQLRTIDEQQGQRFISELSIRNRQFEATLIALQVYAQKVDDDYENIERLKMCLKSAKERCLNAERKIAKETKERSRLEDEILVVKSESVVELALLKAEYERKQDLIRSKLVEDHKQDLEKARKRNVKMMEELKRGRDLKMKRVEETYVQDITQMKENHRNAMAELELQHSKAVEELVEERHAEIETIKADYEEQMEQLQDRLSESDGKCNKLTERLKAAEEESKRDIDLRIQDAIAKYKTLPDELESMKFVLEMKNNEVKKLRQSNGDLQNQIDELQRVRDRAALLEREKESLNFVVENKVQFERQLSLERDKLRLSLDREVAASKRLSLENEELAWRLNAYQNSPTSPTFDRTSWRMSGLNSPDSAMFSQRIEESDLESQIDDTKERSS